MTIRVLTGNGSVSITRKKDGVNDGVCDEKDLSLTKEARGYHFVAESMEVAVEFVSDAVLETAGFKLVFTSFLPSPGESYSNFRKSLKLNVTRVGITLN